MTLPPNAHRRDGGQFFEVGAEDRPCKGIGRVILGSEQTINTVLSLRPLRPPRSTKAQLAHRLVGRGERGYLQGV